MASDDIPPIQANTSWKHPSSFLSRGLIGSEILSIWTYWLPETILHLHTPQDQIPQEIGKSIPLFLAICAIL